MKRVVRFLGYCLVIYGMAFLWAVNIWAFFWFMYGQLCASVGVGMRVLLWMEAQSV